MESRSVRTFLLSGTHGDSRVAVAMRLAAVDVGSNTVHALVADVVRNRLEEVAHYVEMPELGARVARTGSIGTKGRFAIRALRSVVNRARKDGYDTLLAAATE